ncbi:DUF6318 family protein [Rothia sp. ZJ1223]|uniref:DUF6318 family protein n=1 Tax=Rothia sp. ZJ1223 TaxID=2811098 RepID=UPI00195A2DB5|nr:DUF6318 family protein [Rothia sp. ZJ1223]MBM7051733.1 hypothetical protein [Rothia sp. ZJ1223]
MCLMPSKSLAVLALAGVALVGCSAKNEATAESTASATASVSETQATASSSASSSEPEVSPLPTLANGEEVKLSDEERTAYEAGKYVPATETHPALNVPKPVMPELAKEQSFEGAKAFIEYWIETENYAHQTGKSQFAEAATSASWKSQRGIYDYNRSVYAEGAWLTGGTTSISVEGDSFVVSSGNKHDAIVIYTRDLGGVYENTGAYFEDVPAFNETRQPQLVTVEFVGGQWEIVKLSGIDGVDYGADK